MSELKKFQLKPKESSSSTILPIASVFGDDSDPEIEAGKEIDLNKKFQMKYGSNKTRDKRTVEEALADDPDVYEYDSLYDSMESKRNAKTQEQKEADKIRQPKYAHNIVRAAQKRQMEHLMVEERKQAKERLAEGEEFKDKEAFVTGAYKKQIEEREKIRKELEEEERLNGRLKVEDQLDWQANFNRQRLDEMHDDKSVTKAKHKPKEEAEEFQVKPPTKLFEDLKPGLNKPKKATTLNKSPTPERHSSRNRRRSRTPSRHHDRSHHHHRRRRHHSSDSSPSQSPPRRGQRSEKENDREDKPKTEKEILKERLEKIKEILKQRNNDAAIFMARQRYLQRKQNGEIRVPI